MDHDKQHFLILAGLILTLTAMALILGDFLLPDWQQRWPFHLLLILLQMILIVLLWRRFSQRCQTQISEAKDEREIGTLQQQAERVLESLGDGIAIVDRQFQVIYQNAIHRQLADGFHGGDYCYRAFAKQNEVCTDCPVAKTLKDGKVHRLTKTRNADREINPIEIVAAPLKNERGEVIAGIETVRTLDASGNQDLSAQKTN